MPGKNCVLILGRSLYVTSLASCLALNKALQVIYIDPQSINLLQQIEAFVPHAILFDLTDPPSNLDISVLRKQPDLLLIGVDPSSDEVLVIRGQRNNVVTTDELNQLITNPEEDQSQPGLNV